MKNTKSRQKIKDFFNQNHGAFSVAQVHAALPQFDLATIYRNLNLFVEEGVVRELHLTRGESLYESAADEHDHAICGECGSIRHIKLDKDKVKHLINLDDFEVEAVEVVVRGRCKI